jgi:hypothetical protein
MRNLLEPLLRARTALPIPKIACRLADKAVGAPARLVRALCFANSLVCLLAAGLMLSGCAGYRLGPTNGQAAGEKSVQITPFANQTLEPRLGDAVTSALRKQLQKDGTYRLATRDTGDIVVNGVITHYLRQEQTLVPQDVATVQDYRIALTAKVTARDRTTGKILLDQLVTGHTLLQVGSDLTSAEREALPLLATDFARQVTALLADGSW